MNFQNIRTRARQQFLKEAGETIMPELTSDHSTERRRGSRTEVETLVAAITKNGSRFEGYCRNLSQEGTAAIIWGELKVGEEVGLAFRSLGSNEETLIPAIVRNAIAHRYGFEFKVEDASELHQLLMNTCRIEATYS